MNYNFDLKKGVQEVLNFLNAVTNGKFLRILKSAIVIAIFLIALDMPMEKGLPWAITATCFVNAIFAFTSNKLRAEVFAFVGVMCLSFYSSTWDAIVKIGAVVFVSYRLYCRHMNIDENADEDCMENNDSQQ